MKQERAFTADSPIGSYWLGHCTGFWLRGGRRSGTVEEIGLRPDGRVASVSVRRRGFVRNRLIVVPIEWIGKVDPWDEEIVLARRRDRGKAVQPPQLLPSSDATPEPAERPRIYERPPLPPPNERAQEFPLPAEPAPPSPAPAMYAAPTRVAPEPEPGPEEERRHRFGFRRPAPAEPAPEIAAAAAGAFAVLGAQHLLHDEPPAEVEEPEVFEPLPDEAVAFAAVTARDEPAAEEEPVAEEAIPELEPEELEPVEEEALTLEAGPEPVGEEEAVALEVVPEPEPDEVDEWKPDEEPEDETRIAAAVALPELEPEPAVPAGPSAARQTATRGLAVAAVAAKVPGRAGTRMRPAGRGAVGLAKRGARAVAIVALLVLELAARGTQYGTAALIRLDRACRAFAVASAVWVRAKVPLVHRGAEIFARGVAAAMLLGTNAVRRLALVGMAALQVALAAILAIAQAAARGTGLVHAGRAAGSGADRVGGSARASAARTTDKGGSSALQTTGRAGAGAARVTPRARVPAGQAAAGASAVARGPEAVRVTGKASVPAKRGAAPAGAVLGQAVSVAIPAMARAVVATVRLLGRAIVGAGRFALAAVVVPFRWIGAHAGPVGEAWALWRASRRWQEGRSEPLNAQRRPRRDDISLPPGVKLRPTPIEQTTQVGSSTSSHD